jgi:hypothetical protein
MNLSTTIKTPRHHDANRPFGATPMVKTKQATKYVDPATLVICSDPLPAGRALPKLKYEDVFSKLKPGQCVKCEPEQTGKLSSSLRKYMERHNIKGSIKSVTRYPTDQMGRVWMMAPVAKAE